MVGRALSLAALHTRLRTVAATSIFHGCLQLPYNLFTLKLCAAVSLSSYLFTHTHTKKTRTHVHMRNNI